MVLRFPRLLVVLPALYAIILPAAPASAFPPNTLAEALPRTSDRARRRVPLVALDVDQTTLYWDNTTGRVKLNQLYGYSDDEIKPPLPEVLDAFRRQIISCGSVAIVAPTTRVDLNPDPGAPEKWAQIGRQRATRLLFGSLSPAQWATASGPNGLGMNDLTKREQKAWFAALMPTPFLLKQVKADDNPGMYQQVPDSRIVTVTPDQVRLRVTRSMSWMYGNKQPNSGYWGTGTISNSGHKPGDLFWIQQNPEGGSSTVESYREQIKDLVRTEEPNRLRKSDVSFDSAPLFGKTISLKEAATVGDIVLRVAQATGLELYVDRRLSGMKTTFLGPQEAQVDAADMMKALCYAVAGAIRKVSDSATGESVYLLTGDRDGVMTKRYRLAEWASDVDALERAEQETFYNTVKSGGYADNIGFADTNASSVNPDAMRKAEKELSDPQRWQKNSGFIKIPVSALSPAGRAKVEQDMSDPNRFGGEDRDTQNVYASFNTDVQLVVPGYGAFSGPSLAGLDSLLPSKTASSPVPPVVPAGPITLPVPLAKFATLKITPKNNEEMERAAIWAQAHGFSSLFVRVPLWDSQAPGRLADWVAIGKRHGIAVSPVVSLLRAEMDTASDTLNKLAPARNIWGETLRQYAYRRETSPLAAKDASYMAKLQGLKAGLWLDASHTATRAKVAERVHALAQTPGIAGMLWENVAAPGSGTTSTYFDPPQIGLYGGYTAAARLALIRRENVDPLDLPPGYSLQPYISASPDGWVPFFWTDNGFRERFLASPAMHKDAKINTWTAEKAKANSYEDDVPGWKLLRVQKNREYIGELRRVANLPETLPIFVNAPTELDGVPAWLAPWSPAEPLLPLEMGKEPLMALTLRRESTAESVRRGLGLSLAQRLGNTTPPRYSGLIIDTTAKPLDEALSLLAVLAPVP